MDVLVQDDLYVPRSANKKETPTSVSAVFKHIIAENEIEKSQNINVIQLSQTYKMQHRRVYDFFNFLTSFGVCRIIERKKVGWVGIDNFYTHLQEEYENMERDSCVLSMKELFELGPSPSLGNIGSKFLCLFIYLNIKKLSMKNVSAFFHDPRTDIKSLERRIYLVLSFLEIIGVIQKGHSRGEYMLTADVSSILQSGFEARKAEMISKYPNSLENLLNNFSDSYVSSIYEMRRAEFEILSRV